MMHRSRFGKTALLALVAVVALSACAPLRGKTAPPETTSGDLAQIGPADAPIVFWYALNPEAQDLLLDMIDDFNASNEWGITVVGEDQGDQKTLYDRVLDGAPTGQLPNLVMNEPSFIAAYAARDIAVPLTPYMESDRWGFSPDELGDFYSKQHTGFPACRSMQVLFFNRDWLKELDHESPPQTWNEFREIACAASNPAEDLYGFEFGMDPALFTSLLTSQGISILNTRASRYVFDNKQGQAALTFLNALIQDGCAVWETREGPLADFSAGMTLFTVGWADDLEAVRDAIVQGAKFDWDLAPLPAQDDPTIGVRGDNIAILRSTPQEQLAAWLFVKWMAEPAQQARWAQDQFCFPTRRAALAEMEAYLAEHPLYARAAQLLELEWFAEPDVAGYEACRGEIGRMLYAVTAGEDLARWLSDTVERCNQTLTDAAK